MSNRIPVRGVKFDVFDCDAKQIHVGDYLTWVETAGRYGETRKGAGTVTSKDLVYGCIATDGGMVQTHWEWKPKDGPEGLYCRHENHTYDHAHKTWARISTKA